MPRATTHQIDQSITAHQADVLAARVTARVQDGRPGSYTSDASKAVGNRTPGAFGKPYESFRGPEPMTDPSFRAVARFWCTLRKQIEAGARLTVRR
jgi:hypothetical protein